mgnify:CR=1 FL=1
MVAVSLKNDGTPLSGSRTVTTATPATVTGIPTGNTCSVTSEDALTLVSGYTWGTPTISAPVSIADTTGTHTVTIGNSILKDRGTFTIAKTLKNRRAASRQRD